MYRFKSLKLKYKIDMGSKKKVLRFEFESAIDREFFTIQ